jgi:cyclohex-1-ene-1-carbonyl-CoA dehydrogenase
MPKLTAEQQRFQQSVRKIAEDRIAPLAEEMEATAIPSAELCELYREEGWLSVFAPTAFGGNRISSEDWYLLNEEVSRVSIAAALMAEFGPVGAVALAPAEQHADLFPAVVGRMGAFACTEPEAGSDVLAMRTQMVDKGGYYVLNGHKCFINNGGVAEIVAVVATVQPGSGREGIRVLLLDPTAAGVTRSEDLQKMGLRGASLVDFTFDNVEVPAGHVLGGSGFGIVQRLICDARITLAAMAIGNATAAMQLALEHSLHREQFGRPIYDNQAVSFKIADMATTIEAARELAFRAASSLDDGEQQATALTLMAKVFATDVGMAVTTDAVQCLGGRGYLRQNGVERMMRDAKALQITGGTNEIQRVMISRLLAVTPGLPRHANPLVPTAVEE